jgi:DNA-binding MarR family transcriptional regulator
MGEILRRRIKQEQFSSPYQEAFLSLLVAADHVQRKMDESCEANGITSAQYNVLRILRGVHPNGHPRCDIIDRMLQEAPDVTRLIDRLEKAGLVSRGKSEEDGRLSLTFITKEGLALLDKMQPHITEANEVFSAKLSEQEALQLTSLCERIFGE